jgi:hypothetical protein
MLKEIIAKFDSTCGETGREIKKGNKCLYCTNNRKAYHMDSDTARDYWSHKFDEDILLGGNC